MSMTPAPALDISGAFRAGWRGFLDNILWLLGIALIVWLVTGVASSYANQTSGAAQVLWNIVSFFLGQVVAMVWIAVALAIVDGREVSFDAVLPDGPTLLSYVIASFLFSVMVGVGLVLLIIPGIVVAVVFGLYGWALVDKRLPPLEALQHSSRITRGHRWELVGFGLMALALNILGLLLLIVGVLVTSAVTLIALGHVYRQLDPV